MNAPTSERAPATRALPRLSLMFSLEIASIAAYAPLLSLHARESLNLSPLETSLVFATGPVTAMLAPPLAGWLADRVLRAELALAAASLARALSLCLAARADGFLGLASAMALHGFFAGNSGVLVSTIAFSHLPDARRVGGARFWGTASWVVMVWAVMAVIGRAGSRSAELGLLHGTFYAGAAVAFLESLYALTLPATRPPPISRRLFDSQGALQLLRSPRFVAALVVALLYGSLTQLNLMLQGLFFANPSGLGLSPAAAGRATTVSQLLELALFPLLAALLDRFGVRKVVLFGIAAWVLRYLAYFTGQPTWLVVIAQVLHGPNFVLGFVGLQIAVELMAPAQLRGRAQAVFITSSSGIGSLLGQLGCGALLAAAARPNGTYAWRLVFSAPLAVAVVATLITAAWVRDPERLS